jgi:hypothetical protein
MNKQFLAPASINIIRHAFVTIMKKQYRRKSPVKRIWGGIEIPNNLTGAGGIYICTELTAGKINKNFF